MFDPLTPILVFLLTAGAKDFCAQVLHRPFGSAESAIIAAAVAALVLFANQIATLLPPDALPAVAQAVGLIVLIASAFGIHGTVKLVTKSL